eukprot:scaffold138167_cov21-Tisochrysis_lutea.AAC.1
MCSCKPSDFARLAWALSTLGYRPSAPWLESFCGASQLCLGECAQHAWLPFLSSAAKFFLWHQPAVPKLTVSKRLPVSFALGIYIRTWPALAICLERVSGKQCQSEQLTAAQAGARKEEGVPLMVVLSNRCVPVA